MVKKYLDETGLAQVATHVNSRLKTVTVMPPSAKEDAIRLYCGPTDSNFIKGHTYQMRPTLEQRLQFSADTTTYFMTQDGTITDVAPTSYSSQIESVPVTDPETGAELVYMAGNNALVQRLGGDVNTITVDFNKIKSSVMPWWTAGAATGSYNPYTIRNVKLVSITEWVDITPSGSILSVGNANDLLAGWTSMNNDSTAVVNVTKSFTLAADYDIPTGRHFLLKGSDADKTTLWTNDGRVFSANLEISVLIWTELHDESVLSKVSELPPNPLVGDTVLFNGKTGSEIDGHIYKYKDLIENFIGAEVDGTFYNMNGNAIVTPESPEYSTNITVSEGGYVLCVDSVAGKLFAKKTEDDTTYSVTMKDDGTFTAGNAYVPESSAEATAGNIATWSVEKFKWVDLTPGNSFNPDDFDVSDSNEVSLVPSVSKTFIGTKAEWEALSLEKKNQFIGKEVILTDDNKESKETKEDFYIFMSDSYDDFAYGEGWIEKCAGFLGLKPTQWVNKSKSGGSFQAGSWLEKVTEYRESIDEGQANKVTHIVLGGGINDCLTDGVNNYSTEDSVKAYITKLQNTVNAFMSYVNTNFPNAVFYYCPVGYALESSTVLAGRGIDSRRYCYRYIREVLTMNKNTRLPVGIEFVLHNKAFLFTGDYLHPNSYGCLQIARYIAQAVQNGSVYVGFTKRDVSITHSANHRDDTLYKLNEELINDKVVIRCSPLTFFDFTVPLGFDWVDLGELDCNYFQFFDEVTCYISMNLGTDTQANVVNTIGFLRCNNRHLELSIRDVEQNSWSYKSYSGVTTININVPEIIIPANIG